MAALDEQEIQRYQRQVSLPEFGLQGQAQLKDSSVLIVGVGGLGTPAAQYLAAAGVGRLGLMDDDFVEIHNLQRQILYSTEDVGMRKVERATARLTDMNPGVRIEAHPVRLTAANAEEFVARYDVIIDGTDHLGSRQILNSLCVRLRKPLIYGALFRFEGVASVFCAPAEHAPCYACLHGAQEPPPGVAADCNEAGVLGVLPGVIGLIQATEAIKVLCGIGKPLVGRLLQYDALTMKTREWTVPRNPECEVCGSGAPAPRENRPAAVSGTSSGNHSIAISQMPVRELKSRLDQIADQTDSITEFQVLDVREPHELEISEFPRAILIPIGQLAGRLEELDREMEYAVICKSGGRSARAVAVLMAGGFTRTHNVTGGINAWAREIDPSLPEY